MDDRSELANTASDALLRRAAAIPDRDDHRRWDFVQELHTRTDRATFELALALAVSSDTAERLLGLDVLGQYGYPADKPFLEETLPLFAAACEDPNPEIVNAAICGFGHGGDSRALPHVLAHTEHPDADVRFAVVTALPMIAGSSPAAEAIDALVALTTDTESGIRDWAAFGLGVQTDVDTPAVREALAALLTDIDGDTAAEAAVGLARRGDPRALKAIQMMLGDNPGTLILEAAEELGASELLPALRALRDETCDGTDFWVAALDAAIEACEAQRPS